jgi:hypothetical protein
LNNTRLNGKCKWITEEEENYKCAEIKSTCESISRNKTCEVAGVAGTKTCKWIAEEEDNYKCAEIKSTCESINRNETCVFPGATLNFLPCVWIDIVGSRGACLISVVECFDLVFDVCELFGVSLTTAFGLTVRDAPCIWNAEVVEGMFCESRSVLESCSSLKNQNLCENSEGLVPVNLNCSWLKNSDEQASCVDFGSSEKCSFYSTLKGCSMSKEGKCSWIKTDEGFSCVVEKTADFCEFYVNGNGCTESVEHDLCIWNSTTGKCTSGTKSCPDFSSKKACGTLSDECFWNGAPSSSQGRCLSLEETYMCSDLSIILCENHYDVKELIVEDEPCFFNGVDSEAFECVSVETAVNSVCRNIKTNGMPEYGFSLSYCNNAQFLFNINGENGMGCVWDEDLSACIDAAPRDGGLPVECSEYEFEADCRMHVTRDGKKCYWNVYDGEAVEAACMDFEDAESCNSICTNDASGIGSYICDGNIVQKDSVREVCRWEQMQWENVSRNCNCEGDPILENCTLKMMKSPSDCSSLLSAKGSCFYNNGFDAESKMFLCSDMGDVRECGDILNDTNCIYARKHTFQNLDSESSVSRAVFVCLWDVENEICRSKRLDAIDIIPESEGSFALIIVFVIIGVCAVIISAVVITIIIVKMRRRMKNKTKEYEMTDELFDTASLRLAESSLTLSGLINL